MAASMMSNFDGSLDALSMESSRKKRRKTGVVEEDHNPSSETGVRWRSETEQRIYSTKLVEALRQVRRRSSTSSAAVAKVAGGGRDVKEAADRVLATAAKGTTRWSRAILTARLRISKTIHKRRKARVTGDHRLKKTEVRRERIMLPVVQKKVRVLSRLVPGCRKTSLPNLLEETTDYIAALKMQVRAMAALAELLTGSPVNRPGSSVNS
ncbi:transcription factor bHLH149-like [Pyrus ussuriensis x Pyrus communis]|uniref:Transcription factor bHLH149-like n=1 Tax=Pyrus ussuriensis x Pyrus communis TaxID=2448454 RepID=A0A5N5H8A2_9ROSA|nr:transcription factor bHLH149-like [Pyrus ussuriensis x Pyrus communis]